MKIVFTARRFYPEIGGVEKHVMEISKRLIQKGHQVTVITEKSSKTSAHETINGIEVFRIAVGKEDRFKKIRIWKSLWQIRSHLVNADIIHCHDVFFWYLPFRFLYPKKSVYTTFHGYESFPLKKKAIIIRKISEKLSRGNICIGDFIPKWYGTKPTYVSYGAVELPAYKKEKKISTNSALFFGRLDEQTGVLEYLKAYEFLKNKISRFSLLVIGDGEQKKKIDKKIKVLPFQANPEKYFEKYHFAFVSRYLSILEAFAAKRPVVALYDTPIKEDYLRLAPFVRFIIIEKYPEKIAERMIDLLNNPAKEKKMVDAAYTWVEKQTWEKMVDLYLKLWKNH